MYDHNNIGLRGDILLIRKYEVCFGLVYSILKKVLGTFGVWYWVVVELGSSARGCQRLAQCEHAAAVVCTKCVEQQRLQGGETSPALLSDDHSWHSSDFSQVAAMTTAEAFQSGQMEDVLCDIFSPVWWCHHRENIFFIFFYFLHKANRGSELFSTQPLGPCWCWAAVLIVGWRRYYLLISWL